MRYKPVRGVYIHVPFCRQKCRYCAFYSVPAAPDVKEAYTERLCREIAACARAPEDLRTLYVGGGTPSELSADQLARIVRCVEQTFERPLHTLEERTIEINPFSASTEKLEAYRALGFNRLSVGVQSLSAGLLKTLGRPHSAADALRTIEAACRAGFENISVDIMFGLPGQRAGDVRDTLEALLAFPQVRHLSAYALSVEPDTPFERLIKTGALVLPDEDSERDMQRLVNTVLAGRGFEHYEISNYALPGYQAVHNTLYWTLDGYYGFGSGASGFAGGKRYTVKEDLKEYLTSPAVVRAQEHTVDAHEARGDFMFLGLRRLEGVCARDYRALFGTSFFEDYAQEIAELTARGLLMREGERVRLTAAGTDFANQVFMAFV